MILSEISAYLRDLVAAPVGVDFMDTAFYRGISVFACCNSADSEILPRKVKENPARAAVVLKQTDTRGYVLDTAITGGIFEPGMIVLGVVTFNKETKEGEWSWAGFVPKSFENEVLRGFKHARGLVKTS